MLFSHISDTHLGLTQYNSEERETDFYDSFNQAIDISIKDHVDFVIFAGDIFHNPNPNGTAIMNMAHALKKLKKSDIESFFILGEHDISRLRSYPIPYVYHKLEFSRYVGDGKPTFFKNVLIAGFDKIRKSEMSDYENKFKELDSEIKKHSGHKILVLHQGISEVNKFAGELSSNDLPKNFTYYAMGHLHDKFQKLFSNLGGPLAYPGSTELTTSEVIKQTKKGFFEVDISTSEAIPEWLELEIRPQYSKTTNFNDLEKTVEEIVQEFQESAKKPIVELLVQDKDLKTELIQSQIARLIPHTLHCSWKLGKEIKDSSVFIDKPAQIGDEMLRLATSSLKSEKLATFAIKELLPLLTNNNIEQANQIIIENYKQFRKNKTK